MTTVDQNPIHNLESMGWDDLVSLKRNLLVYVKELTDKIIDIERNEFRLINENIHQEKNRLDILTQRSKQIRAETHSKNSQLLEISEKISKSKNFLCMVESKIQSENENELIQIIRSDQKLIDEKRYKNERERNEIISWLKEASMKLEAIKAIRTIKEQLLELNTQTENINKALRSLDNEHQSLQIKITESHNTISRFYESKRHRGEERESYLKKYDETLFQLGMINSRLDTMAEMRKKQRKEYGHGPSSDALFKVKEAAKKKLESGAKLSFDELKLLYSEKDK